MKGYFNFLLVAALSVSGVACGRESIPVSHEKKADRIEWQTDYEKAQQMAKSENKPMLLFFTGSDWCGWCKRLDREVFSQKEFAELAGNSYIFVEIDLPRRTRLPEKQMAQNERLVSQYGVQYFPTVVLVSPSGQKLGSTGYKEGGPRSYADHLKQLSGTAARFEQDLESAFAGQMSDQQLQRLYQESVQLGREEVREQLLSQGLEGSGSFFLLEKYRQQLEQGRAGHPETLALREHLLGSEGEADAYLQLSFVEFNHAADQPHMSPYEVITPLVSYLRQYETHDPDNAWQVQLFLSQYLFSQGEREPALDYAERSLVNVPEQHRPSVESYLQQLR